MSKEHYDCPIVECPICFETENDPYILPSCGHSFCLGCITRFKKDANTNKQRGFVCSLCRVKCQNPNDIRKNYALIDLKQRYNKKKRENMLSPAKSISSNIFIRAGTPFKRFVNLKFMNGDRYEGQVNVDNKMDGSGTYYYSNGDRYTGEWVEDKQTGFCCY